MRVIKRYSEDLESERELRVLISRLSKYIAEDVAKRCLSRMNSSMSWREDIRKNWWKYSFDQKGKLLNSVYSSKYLRPFYEFLDGGWISLATSERDMMGSRQFGSPLGVFYKGLKTIMINCESQFNGIIEYLDKNPETKRIKPLVDIFLSGTFRGDFEDTLIHEMSHAYVDFVSDSKVPGYSSKNISGNREKDYTNVYLSDPNEINSFISSDLYEMEKRGYKYYMDNKTFWKVARNEGNINQYLVMKKTSDDVKKRVIGRVMRWYEDPPRGKIESDRAITIYSRAVISSFDFYAPWNDFESEFNRFIHNEIRSRDIPSLKGLVDSRKVVECFLSDVRDLVNKKVSKNEVGWDKNKFYKNYTDYSYLSTLFFFPTFYSKAGYKSDIRDKITSFVRYLSENLRLSAKDFVTINSFFKEYKFDMDFINTVL